MGPAVDVGLATEEPDHVRPLDLPDIPDAVFADVLVLIIGEVEVLEAAGLDVFEGFGGVFGAEGGEEVFEDAADEAFLIGAEFGHGDAIEAARFAGELDGVVAFLIAAGVAEGEGALLFIECLEDFIGPLCLKPIGVAFMSGAFIEALRGVTIEDRAAESRARLAVAIATACTMTAGEDEFGLPTAGSAEDGDGGAGESAVAFVVLIELAPDFLLIFLAVQLIEHLADEILLVGLEDLAETLRPDVPVVVHLETKRIIPRQADGGALGFIEAAVELMDECLGSGEFCGGFFGAAGAEPPGGECLGALFDETTPGGKVDSIHKGTVLLIG